VTASGSIRTVSCATISALREALVAVLRSGTVASWRRLSDVLAILRLRPEAGHSFPRYKAGQYMALRREDCRLTRRVTDEHGRVHYVPDLDPSGAVRRGPVTHSYSIASAPFETLRDGHLEFYVVLERDEEGEPGRLTESLFHLREEAGDHVGYYDRVAGDFTLEKRAAGFSSVLLVGTGTGIAPFVSMVKQLHHEASRERGSVRYTVLYANRTRPELAYHEELHALASSGALDLVYVSAVSRPSPGESEDTIGQGRANNLLRHIFALPLLEEEMPDGAPVFEEVRLRVVRPVLPRNVDAMRLRNRLDPARTVVLTCGNATAMADIKAIADRLGMRFEKEDWQPSRTTGA
jgi:ferredoxin-NADP reductase